MPGENGLKVARIPFRIVIFSPILTTVYLSETVLTNVNDLKRLQAILLAVNDILPFWWIVL